MQLAGLPRIKASGHLEQLGLREVGQGVIHRKSKCQTLFEVPRGERNGKHAVKHVETRFESFSLWDWDAVFPMGSFRVV